MKRRGFTLPEVLTVIAIRSAATGFVSPVLAQCTAITRTLTQELAREQQVDRAGIAWRESITTTASADWDLHEGELSLGWQAAVLRDGASTIETEFGLRRYPLEAHPSIAD